jgi:hypothetical protein
VRTEVALGCGIAVRIDIKSVVRAGLHATLAANAALVVEVYDSIRTAEEGVGGADFDAGGSVTMVTSHHPKVAPGLRELSGLHIFHPRSKHSDGNLVLFFTSQGTCVTADTSLVIDDKPIAHKASVLYRRGEFRIAVPEL